MILEVRGLSCGYGLQTVVHDVSLQVNEGDFASVLGANNAGKSTLINCLSGIVPSSSGEIYFNGAPITHMAPFKRVRQGLVQVPEGRQLFPQMTVYENILMGAIGDSSSNGKVDKKILSDVYDLFPRLMNRTSQIAGSLSGGEQQMLAIARGLMSKPKLLMLDEPSLGLAPVVVELIFEALAALNRSGVTILLVEQNLVLSLQYARTAYVLERGEVAVAGTTEELTGNERARKAYLGL